MCIYNQFLKNRKYTKTKKNKGVIPSLPDKRIEYIPAKCGKCIECRKQYAREWMVRLLEEIKTKKNGKFVTFTLNNNSIKELCDISIKRTNKITGEIQRIPISTLRGYDKDNTIATTAVRRFNERWRDKFKKAPRHWLITELGHNGTENIHLHGIIWTDETYDTIRKLWKYGYIWPRPETEKQTYVNGSTIKYIVKYVSKQDLKHKEYRGKVLCSQKIGENYINTLNGLQHCYKGKDTELTYTTSTGHKISLPTYFKKKIFTEEELERLWLHLLDREERYVLGKKIDISKTDQEYKKAVLSARQLNTELGYGQRTNDNRKKYEEERRELMYQTRLKKTASPGSIQKGTDYMREA